MVGKPHGIALLLSGVVALVSCAESAHQTKLAQLEDRVSDDARRLVDESITFADVRTAPATYVGQTVMLGGRVIGARLVPDKTEVEVLQLPLDADGIPVGDRGQSQGRFVAEQESFLDPATLPRDTPVTIIGTVEGEVTRIIAGGNGSGEETTYTYPVVRIVQILNWPTLPAINTTAPWPYQYNPYAHYGPAFWGRAFYTSPFWYPRGYGGFNPLYHAPPPSSGSAIGSRPSRHSRDFAPPQFRSGGGASSGMPSSPSVSSGRPIPPQFRKHLQ